MKRLVQRIVLLSAVVLCLGVSDCQVSGTTYVGYGYQPDYYGDVFYTSPIDRYGYGYGFYGRP